MEKSYKGAKIEGDAVTLDFVKTMMEDFKQQKKLHKRCATLPSMSLSDHMQLTLLFVLFCQLISDNVLIDYCL